MNINRTDVPLPGLKVPPVCHQDDVVNTLIPPSTTPFRYQIQIPANEPPGLYWYHPHPHGFTTFQVNGGATGAIIVGGIEKIKPQVAGLTERVLIVRQQFIDPGGWVPGPFQLTLNFQPAVYPSSPSPIIQMKPGEKHFWRVANSSTQPFQALQLLFGTTAQRKLYFSEAGLGTNPAVNFFITVDGKQPKLFKPTEPPAIVTKVGAVEDWTIENRTSEEHAFHMHQNHFLVTAIDGVAVSNPTLQDTVNVPYWSGKGAFHNVTLRMDFRDPNIAGTFVYHCHVLFHEDNGMMQKIQVDP